MQQTAAPAGRSMSGTPYYAYGYPDNVGSYLGGVTGYFNGYIGAVKLYSAGVLWLKNHVIQNAPELWWEKSTKLIKGKYQAGIAMSRKTYCIGNL